MTFMHCLLPDILHACYLCILCTCLFKRLLILLIEPFVLALLLQLVLHQQCVLTSL